MFFQFYLTYYFWIVHILFPQYSLSIWLTPSGWLVWLLFWKLSSLACTEGRGSADLITVQVLLRRPQFWDLIWDKIPRIQSQVLCPKHVYLWPIIKGHSTLCLYLHMHMYVYEYTFIQYMCTYIISNEI